MIDLFYDLLDKIGYLHPIHPAMTHMPIGLVVGSLFIGGTGLLTSRPRLARAAYYMLVLALIFWLPTVVFGVMDWQRYYGSAWLFPVKMKLALAGVLFVLLATGVWAGYRDPTRAARMLPIYVLSFMTVATLGYFGGQLVYGGRSPPAPPRYQIGQKLFDTHCSGCHAHGGNSILADYPLRGAPELGSFARFQSYIRQPTLNGGAAGPMPPFPQGALSDPQVRDLYDYITQVLEKPTRGTDATATPAQ